MSNQERNFIKFIFKITHDIIRFKVRKEIYIKVYEFLKRNRISDCKKDSNLYNKGSVIITTCKVAHFN